MKPKGTFALLVASILFILPTCRRQICSAQQPEEPARTQTLATAAPQPIQTASYISLDGLALVVVFDKPVNLSASIEVVERRKLAELEEQIPTRAVHAHSAYAGPGLQLASQQSPISGGSEQCSKLAASGQQHQDDPASIASQQLIQGIQLCAKLLTKKTLKLLHKQRLHNCIWLSRLQFLVQLGRPLPPAASIRLAFKRGSLSEHKQQQQRPPDAGGAAANERETVIELSRLPLETLGLALTPRLALTGPNQVPVCGQFSISAHLSSSYGLSGAKLSWSVERIGLLAPANASSSSAAKLQSQWEALERLLARSSGASNLLIDAQLLQPTPQVYEFRLKATIQTSASTLAAGGQSFVELNATHRVSRLDYETPIGTLYGSHLLSHEQQVNPSQDLLLLADIQVPECAQSVKQVGLYWQVSDARVRFEQTYGPFYLARQNTLPEWSSIEFRLNSFYGIRVKKFASASAFVSTGEPQLEAQISNGILVASIGQEADGKELQLSGATSGQQQHLFDYQWSCFDGKTAQPCLRSNASLQRSGQEVGAGQLAEPHLLVDKQRQRQADLRLPLAWFEPNAQLWFGLQRFERQAAPTATGGQQRTEYALVGLKTGSRAPLLAIGPVLVGVGRQRATVRNPLTGAVILVAQTSAVIVGRLGRASEVKSFAWHSSSYPHPLYWSQRLVSAIGRQQREEQQLITELHLAPGLQAAHAHHQFQLTVCLEGGAEQTASLSVDIVHSVSECRLEVRPALGLVALELCNIPLSLSPITYQLYYQPAPEAGSGTGSGSGDVQGSLEMDTNESDELAWEAQMEPLTAGQLSPVFAFSNQSASLLFGSPLMRVARFGAKVCDRLQSCRMFYSAPLQLILANHNASSSSLPDTPNNIYPRAEDLNQTTSWSSAKASLQSLQEAARRANLAGSSIGAIAILSSALNLGQRALSIQGGDSDPMASQQSQQQADELRLLLANVTRESLQFGALSLQRHFHYTDSSQTSLVIRLMANILLGGKQFGTKSSASAISSSLENKFRAMRLITQIVRRSISEQLSSKLDCLADWKSIQAAYEALFGAFGQQHSTISLLGSGQTSSDQPFAAHKADSKRRKHAKTTTAPVNSDSNNGNGDDNLTTTTAAATDLIGGQRSPSAAPNTILSGAISQPNPVGVALQQLQSQQAATSAANRRKREEAIQAYLKALRQAYRALLQAAAIRLPLGAAQQFHYASDPGEEISARSTTLQGNHIDNNADQQPTIANAFSDIVSSLTHLSELSKGAIHVELHELGSVELELDEQLIARLNSEAKSGQLRCSSRTNGVQLCSSFVLALTSFAGKAPFKSLDQTLGAPQLEVSLLSPIDGSDLLTLMSDRANGSDSDSLSRKPIGQFQHKLTFRTAQQLQQAQPLASSTSSPSSTAAANEPFKCYHFDEHLDEWIEQRQAPTSGASPADSSSPKPLECRPRSGLGAFGVFQGKSATSQASTRLSVALAIVGLLAILSLLFLFGCCVNSPSNHDDDEDDEDERNARHPEQTEPVANYLQQQHRGFKYP